MEETNWNVWLDTQAQVASFHPIAGSQLMTFQNHSFFIRYLTDLQEQGYRFQ